LSRTWQMLFRGIPDVQSAVKPISAAEMVLVRIAYAADLPTPDEVIRSLGEGNGAASPRPSGNGGIAAAPVTATASAPALRSDAARASLARRASAATAPLALARAVEPQPAAPPPVAVGRFEELIALADAQRDLQVKSALERDVRLVRFEDGKLE